MQMQVKYHLPATHLHIEKQFVAGLMDRFFPGHCFGYHHHFGQYRTVSFNQVVYTSDVPFGHNQQMGWSVGVDIPEYHESIIFK
jgi:hypothetical protein